MLKRDGILQRKKWEILINNLQLDLIKFGILSCRYKKNINFNFVSFCYLFLIYSISFFFIFLASISSNIYKQSIDFLFSPIASIKNIILRYSK